MEIVNMSYMAEAAGDWMQKAELEAERLPRHVSFLHDVASRVQKNNGKMAIIDAVRVGWNMPVYKAMFDGDHPDEITDLALSIMEETRWGAKPKEWFFNLLMEQLPLLEESLENYHASGEKVLISKHTALKTLLTLYNYSNEDNRNVIGDILEKNIEQCEKISDLSTNENIKNRFMGFRVMRSRGSGEAASLHRRWIMEAIHVENNVEGVIKGTLENAEHFSKKDITDRVRGLVGMIVFGGEYMSGDESTERNRAIDDIVGSWMTIRYNKPKEKGMEKIDGMSVLEHAVLMNASVMLSLRWEKGDDILFGLHKKYGITHFGRYHPDLLLRQWNEKDDNDKSFGVHVGCYADWNGGYYKDMSILSEFEESVRNVDRRVIFVEARNKYTCARRLKELHRKQGREIDFLVIAGHGMQTAVALGAGRKPGDYIYLSDLRSKATDKIKKIYRKNIPILFSSCSVGAKDGLAHGFSVKFEGQSIGPDVPTSLLSFKLGEDQYGQSDFYDVVYNDAKTADYRGGLRVDKIRE